MAVPKTKVSKARSNTRHSNNTKVVVPTLVECSNCHAKTVPHRACAKCGFYAGREVIAKNESK